MFGVRSAVAAPITVQGRLWGAIAVGSTGHESPPPGTEERLGGFAELVATAIAKAESQAELRASRARIVATADETRRKIERDLHDGIQQGLITLGIGLQNVQAAPRADQPNLLADVEVELRSVIDELREISRGVHPAILSQGGLGAAIKALARRSTVPVELDVEALERLPGPVEVAAYYLVSEGLANAAKHSQASVVQVSLTVRDGSLHLSVVDDGVGGVDPTRGSGIVGLTDRVEALGGTLVVASPPNAGTSIVLGLPVGID
jgi:signal transduction histidine kinase